MENNFFVVIENEILNETKHFFTAVGLLLSYYYTLNLEYPKEIACTLKFVQAYFFNIKSGVIPPKVIFLNNKCKMYENV